MPMRNSSSWIFRTVERLASRGTVSFCSGGSFEECLHKGTPQKMEIVSLLKGKGNMHICPKSFRFLKIGIPFL